MRHTLPVIHIRSTRFYIAVGTLSGLAIFGLASQPTWADTACTPPANGPSGSDAAAFTYQCSGTYAGDWTSAYYLYNPATSVKSPLYSETYIYDCATNTWTQNEWDYDPTASQYVEKWVPATTTPNQPTNCSPSDNTTHAPSTSTNTTPSTPAPSDTANSTTSSSTGSDNSPKTTTAAIPPGNTQDNTTSSTATSGNASVTNNRKAGDATTGNSSVEVTNANLVDSTGNPVGNATVFTANINSMNGNLVLDPNSIASAGSSNGTGVEPSAVSASTNTDTAQSNTITATATSGDATVAGNGDGGNATTGNAQVIVNLINIINSAVASGQSFIGTVNIYGDFNGNIYIPQSVVDELLATTGGNGNGPNLISNTNESIINNIDATARSGDATVAYNADAYGTAMTGTANTNVTILNLTGSSVIGQNVLLVFVNVLGHWVGMIVNAPTGAASAEFAGGVSSTPTNANTSNGVVKANAQLSITNNVDAAAYSGNALVAYNQNAGSANSGNANVAVNILNIEDSKLSLAKWFGILFINVFGTWNGNFAILPTLTAATPTPPSSPTDADGIATAAYTTMYHHRSLTSYLPDTSNNDSTSTATTASAILGDTTTAPLSKKIGGVLPTSAKATHTNYALPIAGFVISLAIIFYSERERLTRLLSRK